jgi:hypothetical protein
VTAVSVGTRHVTTAPAAGAGTEGKHSGDGALATVLVTSLSIVLAILVPSVRHWFLVPVTLSGILIGVDTVKWFRLRTDIFDPRAYLGLTGFHFFYLTPILHVALDHWVKRVYDPPDWQQAIGTLAVFNVIGLVIYRCVVAIPSRGGRRRPIRELDTRAFYRFGLLAALVSIVAFGAEIARFGGPAGFITVMTGTFLRPELAGMGWLIILAEAFPAILFALVVVRWRGTLARRPGLLVLLLIGLAVTQFFVGGLKGSRSSTLWPVLLCLILVHLMVREISRKAMFTFTAVVLVFLYAYGLYKTAGTSVLDVARGTRTVQEVSSETGRDLPTMLTGDLGRADVQAVILDRHLHHSVVPAYGSTYLAGLSVFVPRVLLPERPTSKLDVGSQLLYGPEALAAEGRSSKVYGITGEAIMNFGPLGGLVSFAVLGMIVRFARRYYLRAKQQAALAPKLLAPMVWALVGVISADFDNIIAFQLKYALPLATVVLLARARNRAATNGLQPLRTR